MSTTGSCAVHEHSFNDSFTLPAVVMACSFFREISKIKPLKNRRFKSVADFSEVKNQGQACKCLSEKSFCVLLCL